MDPTKPQTQGELIRSTFEIAVRVEAQAKATNGRVTRLERSYLLLGGALIGLFAKDLAPLIVHAITGG